MTILTLAAIGIRIWFMVGYPTAFLGFPDSSQYALAGALNIFRDAQRPAGYPFFLRLVHHFSDSLPVTIAVQHATGVVAGVLLYKAVRRTGAPRWLGLVPAGVAFFGGTGLFLEHSLLADPLFSFLQVVGVYMAINALYDPAWRWPLLTGIAIGLAFWVKTVAITSAILVPLMLLFAAPGTTRRKLCSALVVSSIAVGMILFYVGSQFYFTGYLGYERASAWNLYGRVATFADCSKFTPPSGTAFLCPPEPLGHREPPSYYLYSPNAPADQRFGPPYLAPTSANAVIKRFALSAIEHEPIRYLEAIARGLSFYLFPRAGEGYTPQGIPAAVTFAGPSARAPAVQAEVALLYPNSSSYVASNDLHSLSWYERHTQIEGALLVLLLVLAIAGIFFLPTSVRWAAITFTLTSLFSITFAAATVGYDARYAYPTFGPLAAGAALGAWGIGSSLSRAMRRARSDSGLHIGPAGPAGSTS